MATGDRADTFEAGVALGYDGRLRLVAPIAPTACTREYLEPPDWLRAGIGI